MPTTGMTATTMATWLPRVYSVKPTITYRAAVMFVPMLDHTWEPEIGVGRGDRVLIPGFSQNNAARNRGAGTGTFGTEATVTFDAVTEAQSTLQIDRWYYKAFDQPVEVAAQQMPSYVTLLIEGQGQALALAVDADIAGDNTNGFDAFTTVVGTDNVDITEDDVLTTQTNLNGQNARKDRFLVISPASYASLMKIEAFRNSLYAGAVGNLDGSKGVGYVGKVYTYDVHQSNNLEAGTAGKKNAAFDREAIAYAEQLTARTEKDLNIEDGAVNQYITYLTCGFKIIKNAFGNELDGK